MILQSSYSEPTMPHDVMDRLMTARVASLITALAGYAFMIAPILFFSAGLQANSWNERVVGFLVVTLALIRVWKPASTTAASWTNAGLGCWMVLSPWIFGYSSDFNRSAGYVGMGLTVIGFSIFSGTFTKNLGSWARAQSSH